MSNPNRLNYDEYMSGWLRGCTGDKVVFEKTSAFLLGYEQGKKDRCKQISIASRLDIDDEPDGDEKLGV